jgi:hypothetical protein
MSATSQFPDTFETRESKERANHEWVLVGVGLSGVLSIVAVIIALVALGSTGSGATNMVMATPAATAGGSSLPAGGVASGAASARTVKMSFKSDVEHGRKGPDGAWHDAAVPAIFTVHAGAKITVDAFNYDVAPHSFTGPSLSVNQVLPKGTATNPTETKFTFTAPTTPGRYPWWCVFPCDPWAMSHDGYMRGYVTVTA